MRITRAFITIAILIAGSGLAASASAQTMYRCGNKYQDRPCDGGQPGRAVGSAGTASQRGASDGDCGQRGIEAQKIMWAREGGATRERLLSDRDARGQPYDSRLVHDVYSKRGTAAEVRSAIEAECVAEKERAAQTAATLKALGLDRVAAPAAAPITVSREDPKLAEERRRQAEAEAKEQRCASLNAQLENMRSRQRTGGSIGTMESLAQQGRTIEVNIRDSGC